MRPRRAVRVLRSMVGEQLAAVRLEVTVGGDYAELYWRSIGLLGVMVVLGSFAALPLLFISTTSANGAGFGPFFAVIGVWLVVASAAAWGITFLGCLLLRTVFHGVRLPQPSLARLAERSIRRIAEGTGVATVVSLVSSLCWLVYHYNVDRPIVPTSRSLVSDLGVVQLAVLLIALAFFLLVDCPRLLVAASDHLPPLLSWSLALVGSTAALIFVSNGRTLDLRSDAPGLLDVWVPAQVQGAPHSAIVEVLVAALPSWDPKELCWVVAVGWLVHLVRSGAARNVLKHVGEDLDPGGDLGVARQDAGGSQPSRTDLNSPEEDSSSVEMNPLAPTARRSSATMRP